MYYSRVYYSNGKDKKFSDNSIVGMRAKAVRELRNITKGKKIFGFYSHHVMIFDTPDFYKDRSMSDSELEKLIHKHWIGNVGRTVWDDGKEVLSWYPGKGKDKGKRIYINDKGKILRRE